MVKEVCGHLVEYEEESQYIETFVGFEGNYRNKIIPNSRSMQLNTN